MNDKDDMYMALMAATEQAQPIVDMFAALRRKFEEAGFTSEAAGLLVVEVARASAKQRQ